jgi:hypothetical protein
MKTYKIELWKNGQRHGHGYFDASAGKSSAFNLRDCTQPVSEEERQAIESALAHESPPAEGKVVVTTFDYKLQPAAL